MPSSSGRTPHVDPQKALKLFRLEPTASLMELNSAYRRVVRKFHPDYNPDRVEWAHEAMIKVNAAYDSALEYLASLRYEEVERTLDEHIEAHDRFTDVFASIASSILEGIFIYYQYGLENPFVRQNGVPRFRYRLALKKVATGVGQLERLASPNDADSETLEIFGSFAVAFLQCMRMERVQDPSAGRAAAIAYRHYHTGSELLDDAIRKLLFDGELTPNSRRAAPHGVPVAQAEFLKVLTEHSDSQWVSDAAIKCYLLDRVVQLEQIAERVPSLGIGG